MLYVRSHVRSSIHFVRVIRQTLIAASGINLVIHLRYVLRNIVHCAISPSLHEPIRLLCHSPFGP